MRITRIAAFAAALFTCAVAMQALAQETTPAMLAAAAKEGKVVWYTAVDVKVAESVAKVFRACSSGSTRNSSRTFTTSMS